MKDPFAVQAAFVNIISITITPHGVRVAFGESKDGASENENYFTAIHLPPSIAERFQKLFGEVMQQRAEFEKQTNSSDKPN